MTKDRILIYFPIYKKSKISQPRDFEPKYFSKILTRKETKLLLLLLNKRDYLF